MNISVAPLIDTRVSSLLSGLEPKKLEMFDYCQILGEVYTGYINDEFICCWGLIPPSFLSNQAYLWMWAPEPMKHQLVFIRQSQIQVQRMLRTYDQIVGECEAHNYSAQRWLRWLGAEFDSPRNGLLPFTIRASHG